MSKAQDLGNGVFHLDAHYIKPGIASLYVIIHNSEVAIIETGTVHSLPYVQEFLKHKSISPEQIKYVIPTHVHLDHAGGAGAMMQYFPQAQLIIHPRGARHMIDPEKLSLGAKAVYGESTFKQLYGELIPIEEHRVQVAAHESSVFLNDRELFFIDTPGHAYHHFCVVDKQSRGIFSGDTFGLAYPQLLYQNQRIVLPTTSPIHFNPQALHQSVDLLMSFKPEKMYMTHFNELPEPEKVVDQYRSWIDKLVEMTENIQPRHDEDIARFIRQMSNLIMQEFDLTEIQVEQFLAMDIKLNAQGLTYWYQHREQ